MDQEEQRKIAHLLKNKDLPKHINREEYGKLLLNNIVNQEIEREIETSYQDIFSQIIPKPISKDYDLGSW